MIKKILANSLCLVFVFCCFCGCEQTKGKSNTLIIASPHPIEFSDVLIENFENATGIDVEIIKSGTGEILYELTKAEKPQYDILWGGSYSTVLPRAYLFEEYSSINEECILDDFKNVEGNMTRFSDIPSVIMVNKKLLGDTVINGYNDLLKAELRGMIAMANPRKSSSSLEHLINMLYAVGNGNPNDGWEYVDKLCLNLDAKLLASSSDVYKGVSGGDFAVGLTFEEGGASYAKSDDNIELVYMEEGVLSTPDGVYIVKNSPNMKNAKLFVDYLTSKEVQTYMVENLNRRSIRVDVLPPSYMKQKSKMQIINIDYEFVGNIKEDWLEKFDSIYDMSVKRDRSA